MATPLLEMRGIGKSYPGVHALTRVDLSIRSGEVLALMGENGAGKSTLIKILGGAQRPDCGVIRLQGDEVSIESPVRARELGIAVIYQEFNLVPGLSAMENVFLGQELTRAGWIQHDQQRARTRELLTQLGMEFDPETPCRLLTVAQQQAVEIGNKIMKDVDAHTMEQREKRKQELERKLKNQSEVKEQIEKRSRLLQFIGNSVLQ